MKHKFILLCAFIALTVIGCKDNENPPPRPHEHRVYGKILQIPNPCLEEPCLPGMVLAIKSDYDSTDYILNVFENGLWVWRFSDELIIDNDTLRVNDSAVVAGLALSEKYDIYSQKYYEFLVVKFLKL